MSDPTQTARRTVLAAGATALAGGVLTACGGESAKAKPASEPGSVTEPSAPEPAAAKKTLAKASEVPVGGGTILKDEKLVITQPTAGNYRCFTAVCPHQGCLVTKVAAGTIDCACHDSKFKDTDGAVAKGPATRPLTEKKITVAADGSISLA